MAHRPSPLNHGPSSRTHTPHSPQGQLERTPAWMGGGRSQEHHGPYPAQPGSQLPTSHLQSWRGQEGMGLTLALTQAPMTPQPPLSLSRQGQGTPAGALHIHPLLTLASKKLLAPLTPSVETSISESRASTCSPLSSCSSPAAALRKISRNCSREKSRGCQSDSKRAQYPWPHPGPARPPWGKRQRTRPEVWVLPSLSGPWSSHLHNGRLGVPSSALPGSGATASRLSPHSVPIRSLDLPLTFVSNVLQTNLL